MAPSIFQIHDARAFIARAAGQLPRSTPATAIARLAAAYRALGGDPTDTAALRLADDQTVPAETPAIAAE